MANFQSAIIGAIGSAICGYNREYIREMLAEITGNTVAAAHGARPQTAGKIAPATKFNGDALIEVLEVAYDFENKEKAARAGIAETERKLKTAQEPAAQKELVEKWQSHTTDFEQVRRVTSSSLDIEYILTHPDLLLAKANPVKGNPQNEDFLEAVAMIARSAMLVLNDKDFEFQRKKAATFKAATQPSIESAKKDLAKLTARRGIFTRINDFIDLGYNLNAYLLKRQMRLAKIEQTKQYIAALSARELPQQIIAEQFEAEAKARTGAKQSGNANTGPVLTITPQTVAHAISEHGARVNAG